MLKRSKKDKVFSGVFGGIGNAIGISPNVLRLIFVLLTFFTFGLPGVAAYIIAAIIIPEGEI